MRPRSADSWLSQSDSSASAASGSSPSTAKRTLTSTLPGHAARDTAPRYGPHRPANSLRERPSREPPPSLTDGAARQSCRTGDGGRGTGDDRDRFADARGLRAYAGASPTTRTSGKKSGITCRWVRNDRLNHAGYLWAFSAITTSPAHQHEVDRRLGATRRSTSMG
uniref:transposase n=1 Tax=Kitasatospora kifunensis TaxID=58351 RepID=UPI0035E444AD